MALYGSTRRGSDAISMKKLVLMSDGLGEGMSRHKVNRHIGVFWHPWSRSPDRLRACLTTDRHLCVRPHQQPVLESCRLTGTRSRRESACSPCHVSVGPRSDPIRSDPTQPLAPSWRRCRRPLIFLFHRPSGSSVGVPGYWGSDARFAAQRCGVE